MENCNMELTGGRAWRKLHELRQIGGFSSEFVPVREGRVEANELQFVCSAAVSLVGQSHP